MRVSRKMTSVHTYTSEQLKASETKMHTRDIIKRGQETIELLMTEKNALRARVKELEDENTRLRVHDSPSTCKHGCCKY